MSSGINYNTNLILEKLCKNLHRIKLMVQTEGKIIGLDKSEVTIELFRNILINQIPNRYIKYETLDIFKTC